SPQADHGVPFQRTQPDPLPHPGTAGELHTWHWHLPTLAAADHARFAWRHDHALAYRMLAQAARIEPFDLLASSGLYHARFRFPPAVLSLAPVRSPALKHAFRPRRWLRPALPPRARAWPPGPQSARSAPQPLCRAWPSAVPVCHDHA